MDKTASTFDHNYDGGGTIQTVATEPHILEHYEGDLPLSWASIEAQVPVKAGDQYLTGHAYSEPYNYCFPFHWIRREGEQTVAWVATYASYRGGTSPVVSVETIEDGTGPSGRYRGVVTLENGQIDLITINNLSHFDMPEIVVQSRQAGLQHFLAVGASAVNINDDDASPEHFWTLSSRQYYDVAIEALYSSLNTGHYIVEFQDSLPANPLVTFKHISTGRVTTIQLHGPAGKSFEIKDEDLTVAIATITHVEWLDSERVRVQLSQEVFGTDTPNRKRGSFQTTWAPYGDGDAWVSKDDPCVLEYNRTIPGNTGFRPKVGDVCYVQELSTDYAAYVSPRVEITKVYRPIRRPGERHYRVEVATDTRMEFEDGRSIILPAGTSREISTVYPL